MSKGWKSAPGAVRERLSAALTVAAFVAAAGTARAQYIFQETMGFAGEQRAMDIIQTRDDGFLTVGWTRPSSTALRDIYVCRYDVKGNPIWRKVYVGNGDDAGWTGVQTSDGGFVIAGETNTFGNQLGITLIKLDPAGNVVWARIYSGTPHAGGNNGVTVRELPNGQLVVVGRVLFTQVQMNGLFLRTDPGGNILTFRRYIDLNLDIASTTFADVKLAQDGRVVIAGGQSDTLTGPRDALYLRLIPDGTVVNATLYGTTAVNEDGRCIEAQSGGTAALGYGDGSVFGGATHVMRLNFGGAVLNHFVYNQWQAGHSALREDIHGDLILGGSHVRGTSAGSLVYSASMLRLNPAGRAFEGMEYGAFSDTLSERGDAAEPTSDCGYILGGWTERLGPLPIEKYLVKTTNHLVSGCLEQRLPIGDPASTPTRQPNYRGLDFGTGTFWTPQVFDAGVSLYQCLAEWCKADYNGDGFISGDDFDQFVNDFENGNIDADFNCDGFLNGDDFDEFVALFEAGC